MRAAPRVPRWWLLALLVVWGVVLERIVPAEGFFGDQDDGEEEEEGPDLYEVLNLDEECTVKEVKQAYRKLSLKYHPDRNPGDSDAERKFREISHAHEILSSDETRFLYEQGGMKLVNKAKKQKDQGGGMHGGFFGGLFGHQNHNTGPDYKLRLRVTLEELYNGAEKQASINRRVVCRSCGKDAPKMSEKTKERCSKCGSCPNEVRMVTRRMGHFMVQQQEEVPSKEKCKLETRTLDVVVERGMQDGEEVVFKYMSQQKPKQIPGDVIVVLSQVRHAKFQRQGNDLAYTMKISLRQALVGFEERFKHLDGHEVTVDRTGKVTKPFQQLTLKGEGMPEHEVPSQFGNMIITVEVEFPKALTSSQIEELKKIL